MPARRIVGTLLAITGVAVFAWLLARHVPLEQLRAFLDARMGVALVLASLTYGAAVPVMALVWKRLLGAMRVPSDFPRLCGILMTTQIGKYLPGNVGHILGRSALAVKSGLPASAVATTWVYEVLMLLGTGVAVGVLAATLSQPGLAQLRAHGTTLGWVAAVCVLGVVATVLASRALPHLLRRFAPDTASSRVAPMQLAPVDFAAVIGLYACAYLVAGASAAILALGLWPGVVPDIALLTAAFSIAWVVGFVTPGAPAGIGIRESLLIAMLGPSMGTADATVLVLALRIATTLSDVFVFGIGTVVFARSREKEPRHGT